MVKFEDPKLIVHEDKEALLKTIQERDLERRESGFVEGCLVLPPSRMRISGSNASSRRESFDSGILDSSSSSPSPPMAGNDERPLQFHLDILDSEGASGAPTASGAIKDAHSTPRIKKKKKKRLCDSLSVTRFVDVYRLTGETLGEGSYGKVKTCVNLFTNQEYAVKIISKDSWHFNRPKMLKEIELYHLCQGRKEIIQLIEYFEEPDNFYLVFEKAKGGPLLTQIQRRIHFTEKEAAAIVRDLAAALAFLHGKGIAHRDLKPENVLCSGSGEGEDFLPVKLCDFDLCSAVYQTITTPKLQSPVGSVEYMAPEVVEAFAYDLDFFVNSYDEDCDYNDYSEDVELTYDKRCDLWSLGIIAYILLCGYLPFSGGRCGSDCGWEDRDEECPACQGRLFQAIKSGDLVFPEQHWSGVSKEAKDLITRLLVRDASQRLDAAHVLEHPWIVGEGATLVLETPSVLRRQESVQEMTFYSEFASNALAIKRNCDESSTLNLGPMKKSATSCNLLHQATDELTGTVIDWPEIQIQKVQKVQMVQKVQKSRNQDILLQQQQQRQQRQQKLMVKQMRRQTSLVVFPEDMSCRWEF